MPKNILDSKYIDFIVNAKLIKASGFYSLPEVVPKHRSFNDCDTDYIYIIYINIGF